MIADAPHRLEILKEIATKARVNPKWSAGVLIALGAVYVAAQVYVFGIDRLWYAMEYGADAKNVFINPQPHDCDFWKAPVGKKYCHYEKAVIGDGRSVDVTWIKRSD